MLPALVTLLMGLILGYLAQRSRICFIGGLRDFILVRDTELVKGAIAFFLTAWLAFSAANALGLTDLRAPALQSMDATAGVTAVVAPTRATGLNAIFPELTSRLASTKPSLWVMTVLAGLALGLFFHPGERLPHAPTRPGGPGAAGRAVLPGGVLLGGAGVLPGDQAAAGAYHVILEVASLPCAEKG